MVARIKRADSLSRTLNYNEKKVQQGVAENIMAVNFSKDLEHLNFYDKLRFLEHRASLREEVKANSVHISLNFHPEDLLDNEKMKRIAVSYMQMIGFGNQPYLVYRHNDAGHPHLHIVTTNIRSNGNKIDMHNIGRNQSRIACEAIEMAHRLIKAKGRHQQDSMLLRPEHVLAAVYGKSETRRAITNVLDHILKVYKFSSLPELNAVLALYNIKADRGAEDSRMYRNKGLLYRVLDKQGNPIGVPIKASAIHNKPTLAFLEKKFSQNRSLKLSKHREHIKTWIDITLLRDPNALLEDLKVALARQQIHIVLRENKRGDIYGITFIDLRNHTVFNGSDLGRDYSAKRIMERCGEINDPIGRQTPHRRVTTKGIKLWPNPPENKNTHYFVLTNDLSKSIGELLKFWLEPVPDYSNYVSYEWRKKRKKKKKRQSQSLGL
ncbi:relaxase/mobilization nuclease domain-containing protein [Chitinophaga sp. GbtcB8]|uniref:relaxase/mobilization nuclease domain-containing protein n=1 Tax=Chitinophaga sp. GbtcB8 TaxID=2824753 RepID=UPI001C309DAA|nr:relaxase/mobilization nuclease domain-containing protein [Chitinophaga sp. GbtcB8]